MKASPSQTRWLFRLCLALSSLAGSGACGPDASGPAATCLQAQPCGGDVVGSWDLAALCVSRAADERMFADSLVGSACPTQALGSVTRGAVGTFVFNADLTFSTSTVLTNETTINIPASCLSGLTCADLTVLPQSEVDAGLRPGVDSIACAGSSGCVCSQVSSPSQVSETGTYAITGSVLNLTATTSATETFEYCIQGDTAHFTARSTGATLDVDFVGVKESGRGS
jgi:hypothetical protein